MAQTAWRRLLRTFLYPSGEESESGSLESGLQELGPRSEEKFGWRITEPLSMGAEYWFDSGRTHGLEDNKIFVENIKLYLGQRPRGGLSIERKQTMKSALIVAFLFPPEGNAGVYRPRRSSLPGNAELVTYNRLLVATFMVNLVKAEYGVGGVPRRCNLKA